MSKISNITKIGYSKVKKIINQFNNFNGTYQ